MYSMLMKLRTHNFCLFRSLSVRYGNSTIASQGEGCSLQFFLSHDEYINYFHICGGGRHTNYFRIYTNKGREYSVGDCEDDGPGRNPDEWSSWLGLVRYLQGKNWEGEVRRINFAHES